MTLYLSDTRLHGGARPDGDAPRIISLPRRLPAAAAVTGRLVAEHAPDVIAVLSQALEALSADEPDRCGVVYRLDAGGDVWIPDVLYEHDGEALCAVAESRDVEPAGRQLLSSGSGKVHGCSSAHPVSPAFAGAFAAAISLLGPQRVVGVLAGANDVERLIVFAETLAKRCEETVLRAAGIRDGASHVQATREVCGRIADRLRLTATQRARLFRVGRSAAVRCGSVPPVLEEFEDEQRVGTKVEAKRRLAAIEHALEETARAEL